MFIDGLGAPGGTAQQRTDAREQFVEIVGLQNIIVGAGVKPFNTLLNRVACGGNENRGAFLACPQCAQYSQAVALR